VLYHIQYSCFILVVHIRCRQDSAWICVAFPVARAECWYSIVWQGPMAPARFHNNHRFYSASRNSITSSRPTPSSASYNLLSSKTPKMSQSFSNNINSLNTTVNNLTVADDRSNILAWLSPLNPKLRHQDIQGHRVEKLGEWLLQTEVFRAWNAGSGGGESDNTVLFCYGNPGVGKTFIR